MEKQDPKAGLKSEDFPALKTGKVNTGEIGYRGSAGGAPSSKGYVCPPKPAVGGGKRG